MSRFDLMFMVSDNPDEETDREVVDHMMRSRRAAAKNELGDELSEEERASIEPAIPKQVLRAYIAYAKEECNPYLHEESEAARRYLREEFLKLRLANNDEDNNPVPVTYRQEEAIERLAEASARVRLDNKVRVEDVERAVDLVKTSMKQVGIDPETGEFDADVIETGQTRSQRARREKILAILEDQNGAEFDELKSIATSIDSEKLKHDLQHLKSKGRIYRRGDGVIMVA